MSNGTSPVPGWYADPYDGSQLRWWDGTTWTSSVRDMPAAVVPPAPQPEPQPAVAEEASEPQPAVAEEAPEPQPAVAEEAPEPQPAVAEEAPESEPKPPASMPAPVVAPPPTSSADIEALAAKPNRRGLKIALIIIVILVVIVAAGGAAWFFLRPEATSAPADSPSPTPSNSVAPACQEVVTALTANGTTSNVVGRLNSTAASIDLPGAVQYFSAVTTSSAPILATSGTQCLAAVGAQQAPTTYATFIAAFAKALKDGVAISAVSVASAKVAPPQAAVLVADAKALTAAATGLGVTPTPPAAPAPVPSIT